MLNNTMSWKEKTVKFNKEAAKRYLFHYYNREEILE